MTPFEFLGWGFVGVLAVWVCARLVTAAYFYSRQQYEERKQRE